MNSHTDIVVEKKSNPPYKDKSVHDTKLLIHTLKDFFTKHPLINHKAFLEDDAFDSAMIYEELLTSDTFRENRVFYKAYIPLNSRYYLKKRRFYHQ